AVGPGLERAKSVREPEVYSGQNQWALDDFIKQFELVFETKPLTYRLEVDKSERRIVPTSNPAKVPRTEPQAAPKAIAPPPAIPASIVPHSAPAAFDPAALSPTGFAPTPFATTSRQWPVSACAGPIDVSGEHGLCEAWAEVYAAPRM
ncbi:hypothetical protein MMC29_004642, partial [Sticta canariensis]|nr:hypothetical protein [Sticta canariensis]